MFVIKCQGESLSVKYGRFSLSVSLMGIFACEQIEAGDTTKSLKNRVSFLILGSCKVHTSETSNFLAFTHSVRHMKRSRSSSLNAGEMSYLYANEGTCRNRSRENKLKDGSNLHCRGRKEIFLSEEHVCPVNM